MRQLTRKIASLQPRTLCSVMQVTLVRTTKKIKKRKGRKKKGVAVGVEAGAKVVAEAKVEAEVGVEVGVIAAHPRAVAKVQATEPLSKT